MRILRSIFCAGLAMIAVSLCASVPAVAAVPIDAGAPVQMMDKGHYPVPTVDVVIHDVAILADIVDVLPDGQSRSKVANSAFHFAETSIIGAAYLHIDPDIAA
ncbi:hypothetical protein [Agrobacterium tumefaciens]|uniref:hypothetical protein n=1 Tax=Agrobacterium tumefaciens TaxID=358 RepID=UPI0021D33B78|nr:hypothetical protein [Agrobacterium tumefaciens]UXT27225.1 hypothetical protein FY139_16720 [Agrobacterium tumefaciens]UXT33173.1 hypothetical protein FY138_07045 [Agrobacterium tumefaciens]